MLLDVTDREMTHYRILAINTEGITAQIPKCCATPEVAVIIGTNRPISAQLCAHPRVRSAPSNGGVLQKSAGHRQTFFVPPPHFQFVSSATAVNST